METILIQQAVERKTGCLYAINQSGDLIEIRVKGSLDKKEKSGSKILIKDYVKRENGIVYWIDSLGNVCQKKLKVMEKEQEHYRKAHRNIFEEMKDWINLRQENNWGEACRLRDLAFIHINENKLNQAERELELAMVEAKNLGGGILYDMMGDIYLKKGEKRNALHFYNKSLRMYSSAKKRDKISRLIKEIEKCKEVKENGKN